MHWLRRHPFILLCLTSVLLVGQLTACTSWRVQNVPAEQFTVRKATQLVRIVRRNGVALTLQGTRVSADTLYGTHKRYQVGVSDTVVAIPVSDIQSIAVHQGDSTKTILLVSGITLLLGAAVVFVLVTWQY